MTDSLATRLRRFPLLSTAAMLPALSLTMSSSPGAGNGFALAGLLASPFISIAVAGAATIDLVDKQRSGLSKVFSAAAVGLGTLVPLSAFLGHGDSALGAMIMIPFSTAAAGACNIISHYTQNTRISASVNVTRDDDKTPPPSP